MIFHVRENEESTSCCKYQFPNWDFEMSIPFIINLDIFGRQIGRVGKTNSWMHNCRFPSSRSGQFVWSSLLRQWPPFAFQLGKVSSRIHQIRRRCHACSVLTLRAYHVTCGSQSIVLQVRGKTGKNQVTRHGVEIHGFFCHSILREINCGKI